MDHKMVSLADQIFERLENDILSGVYPRGTLLTELRICQELGVSRTPVREALQRLEQEHIIEDRGKGMLVLSITAQDAEQIYEIRSRIEGMAAAACARNATPAQVKELSDLIELQSFYAEKGDSEQVRTLDSRFHQKIYQYSGSAVLYDVLAPLHKKVQKFRRASMESRRRAEDSIREHREMVEAIGRGDAAPAEKKMTEHVARARRRLEEVIAASAEKGEE